MNQVSFADLGLSPELIRAVADMQYTEMTPIQQKIIPLIIEGRDVIGQSSTGTGKTAAFGIPAVEMLQQTDDPNPQILVLCPTRELAMQVSEEMSKYSKYKEWVRTVTLYGGQAIATQIRALSKADIAVGTPGRIIDHIHRGTLRLDHIKMVVLDEADEMLDMGFLDDIRRILSYAPKKRQTLLFSATMSQTILRITQRFLKDPELVRGDDGQVAFELISQYYCEVPKTKKIHSIKLLIEQCNIERTLIFCNTKIMVDILARQLNELGLSARSLHGDMPQAARSQVMQQFKDGTVNVLIATDVAARGIDATGIDTIINYDIPQDVEYYVHRIGRTGRAGHMGRSFTIIAGHGDFFGLADIEQVTGAKIEPFELEGTENLPDDRARQASVPRLVRPDSRPAPRRQFADKKPSASSMALLTVDVGKNQDICAMHLISAITGNSKVKKEEIGDITIEGDRSLIELEPRAAVYAAKALNEANATVDDFVVTFAVEDQESSLKSRPRSRR